MARHNKVQPTILPPRPPISPSTPKVLRSYGKPQSYDDPQELWELFVEYCQDVDANPIMTSKPFSVKDGIKMVAVPKARPYTMGGFNLFLGVSTSTFWRMANDYPNKDIIEVMQRIKLAVATQTLEGGFAGIFHGGLVGKALGMAKRIETTNPNPTAAPDARNEANLVHPDCTPAMLEQIYAAGLTPILYSQAQLAAGIPFTMPPQLIQHDG